MGFREDLDKSKDNNDSGQRRPKQFDVVKSTSKWLEHLASAKVGEELLDRGFEKHLGYGITDVAIKGIEEGNLCVYKKNGIYYITTSDKDQKYIGDGYKLQTIHGEVNQDMDLIEELEKNLDKIMWDLPNIHAIIRDEKQNGQENTSSPKVLITDNENDVRGELLESGTLSTDKSSAEQSTWKAILPWAQTGIEISGNEEISKKRKIEENTYKSLYGREHKDNLLEQEKKFFLAYYASDQNIRKEIKQFYTEQRKEIEEKIKNGSKVSDKSGNNKYEVKGEILNFLNEKLKEIKNMRQKLQEIVHPAIEGQLSKLFGDLFKKGQSKTYIRGDLYSLVVNGTTHVTNQHNEDWALVDTQRLQEIAKKGQVEWDLKVYVIQRPDNTDAENNSDNKDPEILVTDDIDLVARRIKQGWNALPGTEQLRSDNSGPSSQLGGSGEDRGGGSGEDRGDANIDINEAKDYFLSRFKKSLEKVIKQMLNWYNVKVKIEIGGINFFGTIDRIYITNGEYLPGCDWRKPEKLNTISLKELENERNWYFPKLYVTKLGEVNNGQDGDLHIVVTDKETENPLATIDTPQPEEQWAAVKRISDEIFKIEYKKVCLENLRIKSSSEGYKSAMGRFWEHLEDLDFKLSQSKESEKFRSSLRDDTNREWTEKLDRVKKILSNDEYDTNKDLAKDIAAIISKELIISNEEINENNVYKYHEKATYKKLAEIGNISNDNVKIMYEQFKNAQYYENNKNGKNDVEMKKTITISELKGKGKEIIDVPGRGYYRFIYALLMSYNSKLTPDRKMKPDQIDSLANETRKSLVNGGVAREDELLKAVGSQYDPQSDRYKLVLHEQVMYAIAFLRSKNIGVDRGLTVYADRSDDRDSDRRVAPIKVLEVEGNNDPLEVYLSGSHFRAVCKKDNGSTS